MVFMSQLEIPYAMYLLGKAHENGLWEMCIRDSGSDKTYGIYINVRGDIINLGVKYKSSGTESYTYEGTDRVRCV